MTKADKEGQRKAPILRFKGFTDDWEQRKLSDFAHIIVGGTPSTKKNEYWNGNIPWMSSGEINKKRIYKTDKSITKLGLKNSSAKFVPENSVLIALAGQGKTRGTVAINNIELTINQSLAGIVPTSKGYYEFIFYNLEKRYSELRRLSSGAGSRGGLNKKLIQNIKIQIPNLKEQILISKLSETLDNVLTLYDRKLKLLSQVKKYFLDNLFAEKEYPNLRFKGFTDAWEQRKLSEMTQQVKRTSDSENPILTISAKNGWMDQKDRFNRVIAGKELKNYIELYKNELSYNHGNSKYAKFGIIYVQRKYEKALVPKVYHSFSMSYGDPRFIESLSLGHKLDKELSKLITSGARQDGLLNINKKSFYTIKLFIPSEQEQIKISNIMDVINHVITLHDNKKQNLIEIKKKLLNTMFI